MQTLDLPSGWINTSLEQISDEINPGFPSGKWKRDDSEGVPHLRPMNISPSGEIDLNNLKYIVKEGYDALKKGDILFNNTNSPKWIGKTTYIKNDTNWAYSNHMTRIRFNHNFINPAYVSYYLHHLLYKGYFLMNCKHHVNQASVNTSFLKNISIPLPPLTEQVRIVGRVEELLSRLDASVRSLQAAQTQLEQYRQTTLKQAYTGKQTQKWREKNYRILLPQKLFQNKLDSELEKSHTYDYIKKKKLELSETSNLTELPPEWVIRPLIEVATLHRGFDLPKKKRIQGSYPVIASSSIVGYHNEARVKGPGVVTGRSGTIGDVIYNETDFWPLNTTLFVWDFHNNHPKFVKYLLKFMRLNQYLAGTGVPTLNRNTIHPILVPLPQYPEQLAIVEIIDEIYSKLDHIEKYIVRTFSQITYLRSSILKKAFNGRLVPQDPNDEPAQVLIEKIKKMKVN